MTRPRAASATRIGGLSTALARRTAVRGAFVPLVVTKKDGDIELNPHALRHEALCCIPYQVGRDLEEYLWV